MLDTPWKLSDIPTLLQQPLSQKPIPVPYLDWMKFYLPDSFSEEDTRNIGSLNFSYVCIRVKGSSPLYVKRFELDEHYFQEASPYNRCEVISYTLVENGVIAEGEPNWTAPRYRTLYSTDNVLGCRAPLKETLDKEESEHSKCMSFYMYSSAPEDRDTLSRIYNHVASSP